MEKNNETPTFLDILENENDILESFIEESSYVDEMAFMELTEEERIEILEELDIDPSELNDIVERIEESLKRRVSSKGQVSKVRSRDIRRRRATATTGMSRTQLKRRARRAAITRKRNPGAVRKAVRKRKRAMRRRKQLNISN